VRRCTSLATALPLALLVLSASTIARAETVLVASEAAELDGLEADLRTAGETPTTTVLAPGLSPSALFELAEDVGARAVVRVGEAEIEVWLATELGWTLDEALPRDAEDARVRVVETLHARLSPEPVPPVAAVPGTPTVPLGIFVGLEAGALFAPGFEPSSLLRARMGARLDPHLGVVVSVSAPTSDARVRAPEGEASLWPITLAASLRVVPFVDASVELDLEVGVLGGGVIVEGRAARSPWEGATAIAPLLGPTGSIALGVALGPGVRVRAAVELVYAALGPLIGIAERDVARFGEPCVTASLGLEARP
jgi:hypothetical protein